MLLNSKFWKNKKVLITGCTGFSGSWLIIFLNLLRAKVVGYSLKAPSNPSLFNALNLKNNIKLYSANINNYYNLKKIVFKEKPDVIFHLAANAIVLDCYKDPVKTFETNSFGVLNLLELLRGYKKKISVNIITSDKCYRNNSEKKNLFNENSALGGDDVYSASKAIAEIMVRSYKNYYSNNIKVSTIRSGNIIGGGDWGKLRLITDIVLCKYKNKKINIRNINGIRPWQHIFDVIHAYLLIAQYTMSNNKFHNWNVAPHNSKVSVYDILTYFFDKKHIKKKQINKKTDVEKKELQLDSKKIKKLLKWQPKYSFNSMMKNISNWYDLYYKKKNIKKHTIESADIYLKKILNKKN